MTKEQLLRTAKTLPKTEQIDLAMELWESIEVGDDDAPLTEEQKRELDQRIAADDANPQPPQDWKQLKDDLLRGKI